MDLEFIALVKEQMAECCGRAPERCLSCWDGADLLARLEAA